jgi:CBS domain containing-hemolysin-like protein
MVDVVIGNVILTATLVVALLIFVAAASGLATIYTIRIRQTLLENQAAQIAQLIQQVYLIVNSTQIPSNTNYVVKNLGLPSTLDGYPYTVELSTKPLSTKTGSNQVVTLTVTVSLVATYGQASSSVLMGKNFALNGPTTFEGNPQLSAQVYKCAGNTPQPQPPCGDYSAGQIVLQLVGVVA